jgi:hypothetical protein
MSDSRVEQLAAELIALPLSELTPAEIDARIATTIGDGDRDVARAALDLAAEIMRKRTAAAVKHAETLTAISRLAAATGCPPDADVAEWLLGLGLIETDGVTYTPTPKAWLRVVGKDSP